jgi:tetrahydromethanopterin S-methyltransferase subunit G
MVNEKSNRDNSITSNELEYILEVNKKAVSIYNEVAHQNEDIIAKLDKLTAKIDMIDKNTEITNKSMPLIKNIDKSVFRLIIILSSAGIGLIIQIIQTFWHH